MAAKIKVFNYDDCTAALNNTNNLITVIKKKENKTYKGTQFMTIRWCLDGVNKHDGFFLLKDVQLNDKIYAKGDISSRSAEHEGTRLQLGTRVSATGPFGKLMLEANRQWLDFVNDEIKAGRIDSEGKKISPLVSTHYSKKHPVNPGAPRDDPIISFKISFEKFPPRYPYAFMRNQPRTQFYDYATRYVDEKGRECFEPATVVGDNGEKVEVNADNLHEFIDGRYVIRKGRVMINTLSISDGYISASMQLLMAVIDRTSVDGFDDEEAPVKEPVKIKQPSKEDAEVAVDMLCDE